jgi:hypothetical protein
MLFSGDVVCFDSPGRVVSTGETTAPSDGEAAVRASSCLGLAFVRSSVGPEQAAKTAGITAAAKRERACKDTSVARSGQIERELPLNCNAWAFVTPIGSTFILTGLGYFRALAVSSSSYNETVSGVDT